MGLEGTGGAGVCGGWGRGLGVQIGGVGGKGCKECVDCGCQVGDWGQG